MANFGPTDTALNTASPKATGRIFSPVAIAPEDKMFPTKLTEHEYVNADAVARVTFTPRSETDCPVFMVSFTDTDFYPIKLRNDEAEEAFSNWKAACRNRSRLTVAGEAAGDQQ